MSDTLLVPIHLDALCLEEEQDALRAMADYKLLPYVFQEQTHGAGQDNLSEQILAPLFNQEFELQAGIHLHWSLPDALTNGQHDETGTTFRQVPNRWLILRQGGDQGEKQWIIESDYLYPVVDEPSARPRPINVLIEPPDLATVDPDDASTYQYQRYRYMGRSWELGQWSSADGTKEHAEALTVIGNRVTVPIFDEVKATFAAFYPNCHSVFGFCDRDYSTNTPPPGLQYDVIGYYSDQEQDCLKLFLEENQDDIDQQLPINEGLLEILQAEFGWTIDLEQIEGEFPQTTLYHSRITFSGSGNSATDGVNSLSQPSIAVADSAQDAIAAYLAHSFNSELNKTGETVRKAVENKLEAVQLLEKLESRKLDVDAKFLEGRHQRTFGTQHDGYLWTILPQTSRDNQLKTNQPHHQRLPENLAAALNELNRLQEEYNQAWLDMESLRRQLYSQWYYFMNNQDEDDGNFYNTINTACLVPLRTAIAQAGALEFTQDEGNASITANSLPFGIVSQLNGHFNDYVDAIQAAAEGDFDDWDYITGEYANCGVTFDSPTVTTITDGEAWQIEDGGQIYDVKVEGGIFNIYVPANPSQIAAQVVSAMNNLREAMASSGNLATSYNLCRFPSQNYWRANEPVILLTGDAAKAPLRFGQDGRLRDDDYLECQLLDFDVATIIDHLEQLQEQINSLQPQPGEDSINFITWKEQPWNPFAFHWSVLAYPCRDMIGGVTQDYHPNQILDNYSLEPNAIELQLKAGKESSFTPNGNSYTGFSLLSPSIGVDLIERLIYYLTEELLPSYYVAKSIPVNDRTSNYFIDHFEEIRDWYYSETGLNEQDQELQVQDPIFVALWAYEEMQTLESMAQSIGGFNDTLLLAQPTLQLEVDDPISLDETAKVFHEQVRWTLGDSLQYKFLPGDIFNPIRSGKMEINQLWLVDSFGQHQEVIGQEVPTEVVTTYRMTPAASGADNKILLPPRLAQPARINFHWLAANALQTVEMTKRPARTPVCGWILPNNLDSNLAIYDHQGLSLGSIDRAGNWRNAPEVTIDLDGSYRPLLSNHHLQKLVHHLLEQGIDFQQQFLSTLDNSLATIDPESFAEHPSLALLIGRPIAIVRATFSLEVQGLPAWDPTVKIEDEDQVPVTSGFTEVKIPIRLGDYQQLNDGLVGYWKEKSVGNEGDYEYEDKIFYAPQSRLVNHHQIQTEAEGLVYFEQTVDAPPQGVTMLIDPRGVVHATCGVLPNQELRLPAENYNQALQALEVNFLSTPVLCDRDEIAIPLSEEPGAIWSWLSLVQENWSEKVKIKPVNYKAIFSKSQQASEGWLQLSRVNQEEES
ncbi:MAG: hypothetical protein F6K14_16605 [Symploca sp. SIO2C1]|nr:hypothetical protein [Symploca sp. SIO2C1]